MLLPVVVAVAALARELLAVERLLVVAELLGPLIEARTVRWRRAGLVGCSSLRRSYSGTGRAGRGVASEAGRRTRLRAFGAIGVALRTLVLVARIVGTTTAREPDFIELGFSRLGFFRRRC